MLFVIRCFCAINKLYGVYCDFDFCFELCCCCSIFIHSLTIFVLNLFPT
jgi:hypothetical protein